MKPLGKPPRRVRREAVEGPATGAPARHPNDDEPLRVEREGNGIVLGRRAGVHSSIVDDLEDPRLEVEAECDLHGLTAKEAAREVHRFLRQSQQQGKHWVLVIVGKGLHSPKGKGTLRGHVVDALSRGASARHVLAFRTAPRHLGGDGALVVRLR